MLGPERIEANVVQCLGELQLGLAGDRGERVRLSRFVVFALRRKRFQQLVAGGDRGGSR